MLAENSQNACFTHCFTLGVLQSVARKATGFASGVVSADFLFFRVQASRATPVCCTVFKAGRIVTPFALPDALNSHSGVLAIQQGGFAQNGGSFTVSLGGSNPNQSGQLAAAGDVSLSGPLNVVLANGYVPVEGDQFEILSCNSVSGTFSSTNAPAGITVSYFPNYVELVVTGTVPAQIQSPGKTGNIFKFSFGTANNQSYTIQQTTNLEPANWTFYSNIIGNGSIFQFTTPVTNYPQQFFRVRSP